MGYSVWAIDIDGVYSMIYFGVYHSQKKFPQGKNHAILFGYLEHWLDCLSPNSEPSQYFHPTNTVQLFYEKVMAHKGVHAAHKYGAYEAIIHHVCYKSVAPAPIGIPVGTWKKQVIGKGNAKKEEIKEFIINHITNHPTTFPALVSKDLQFLTYDECDAIAMGIYVSQIGVNNVPN